MTRAQSVIGFLTQNDLVDQAGSGSICRRQPRQLGAGQLLLQALGQRHEIPDGEYMGLHKAPEYIQCRNFCKDRMTAKFNFLMCESCFSQVIVTFLLKEGGK